MADAAPAPSGVTTTLAASATTATGGIGLLWLLECIKQDTLVVPSAEQALVLSMAIAPFLHSIRNALLTMLAAFTQWVAPRQLPLPGAAELVAMAPAAELPTAPAPIPAAPVVAEPPPVLSPTAAATPKPV